MKEEQCGRKKKNEEKRREKRKGEECGRKEKTQKSFYSHLKISYTDHFTK